MTLIAWLLVFLSTQLEGETPPLALATFADTGPDLLTPGGYERAAARAGVLGDSKAIVLSPGGILPPGDAVPTGGVLLLQSFDLATVNVSPREADLAAKLQEDLPLVSANLRHADGSAPFPGVRIVAIAGRKLACFGATSPALGAGPEWSQRWQLKSPADTLKRAAATIPPEMPRLLLFYGSDDEALHAARAITASLVLVGGAWLPLEPEETGSVTLAAASSSAQAVSLLECRLEGGRLRAGKVSRIPLSADAAPADLLHALREEGLVGKRISTKRISPRRTTPETLVKDRGIVLAQEASNTAARIVAQTLELASTWKGEDGLFLVVQTVWENRLPYEWVRDNLEPVAYRVDEVSHHLFVRVDGRHVVPLLSPGETGAGGAPSLLLPRKGSRAEMRTIFRLPKLPDLSLELLFLDSHYGHAALTLWGAPPAATEPTAGPVANAFLSFGVASSEKRKKIGAIDAPAGKTFLIVELSGRSTAKGSMNDRAVEFVARFDAAGFTQLVEDDTFALTPIEIDMPYRLDGETSFLPTAAHHGFLVFSVPEDHGQLALHVFMPTRRKLISGQLDARPAATLTIPLGGQASSRSEATPPLEVIADGEILELALHQPVRSEGGLLLRCDVKNIGKEQEIFRPFEQVLLSVEGRKVQPSAEQTARLPRPGVEHVRIPPKGRRSFTLAFPGVEKAEAILYRGFTLGDSVGLETVADKPVVVSPTVEPPAPPRKDAPKPDRARVESSPPATSGTAPVILEVPPRGRATWIVEAEAKRWLHDKLAAVPDLARDILHTQVTSASEVKPEARGALIDGDLEQVVYHEKPLEVVLELLGGREAVVDTVGLFFRTESEDLKWTAEGARAQGEFRVLASASAPASRGRLQVVEFEPVPVSRVRIRLQAKRDPRLTEIFVFEKQLEDRSLSVLSGQSVDIAARAAGGSLFYADTKAATSLLGLIDRNSETEAHFYGTQGSWVPVVVAFRANQEALVRAVGLHSRERQGKPDLEYLPAKMRISASRTDPFSLYEPAGEFAIEKQGGDQVFQLVEPVIARFLKVEFLLPPQGRQARIAALSVLEGAAPGYVPILLRGDQQLSRHSARSAPLESLVTGVAALESRDAGKTLPDAITLRRGEWIRDRSSPADDVDVFRFSHGAAAEIPVLEMHMTPFLRGRLRIARQGGERVHEIDLGKIGGTSLRKALPLTPGEYTLELSSSPVCVLLGFDSSGSMGGTFETTVKAVQQWAKDLPPGFLVSLATSLEDREAGNDFTVFCPYTRDVDVLARATKVMFEEGGGSNWYTVLAGVLDYSDTSVPPGTTNALVYMADGNGSGDFGKMWRALRRSRARLYTIGFGDVGRSTDWYTSWDGERGLFNVAWYRGGRYFEPHSSEELVSVYEAIFGDLRTEPEYVLRVDSRKRLPGTLVTQAPEGESRPVHFIVDASGSMLQTIGSKTRLDIAKEVIGLVIAKLPAGSEVGLRVYGHRYIVLDRDKASKDSELLVRVGKLEPADFLQKVQALRARGGTPLAYSLQQASNDISGIDRPRIICITDGVESFGGNPPLQAAALLESRPGAELAVVGFAVDDAREEANLRSIATAAQGPYYHAADSRSLVDALDAAIHPRIPYVLHDELGKEVARGLFGDRRTLPEGAYRLTVAGLPAEESISVQIAPGREVAVEAPPGARPSSQPLPSRVAPAPHPRKEEPEEAKPKPQPAQKFCTECGTRARPAARFCTNCGTKLDSK